MDRPIPTIPPTIATHGVKVSGTTNWSTSSFPISPSEPSSAERTRPLTITLKPDPKETIMPRELTTNNQTEPFSNEKHESKQCPRCGRSFVCRMGDIARCQCSTVRIPTQARDYIARLYNECLCASCLDILAKEAVMKGYCSEGRNS